MSNPPSATSIIDDDDPDRKRTASAADLSAADQPAPKCSKSDNNIANFRGPANEDGSDGGGSPAPPPVTIVQTVVPCKGSEDPNEYRVIRLSNGLTVLLISKHAYRSLYDDYYYLNSLLSTTYPGLGTTGLDCFFPSNSNKGIQPSHPNLESIPTSVECGGNSAPRSFGSSSIYTSTTNIALVVNMGGLNDPVNCQGLAHFTEHMVHFGSRKFPQEGAVMRLLQNFGFFNAFTSDHVTCYFNEVPDDLLGKNLELFAGMLAEPLFSLDTMGREVQAVDNEFYLSSPHWRTFLLLPYVAIQNQEHPLCRFLCGTVETLTDCKGANGEQTQGVMRPRHQERYVASAMTLAINSAKSLDDMQKLTLAYFSNLLQGPHQVLHKNVEAAAADKYILQNTADAHYTYLQGNSQKGTLLLTWILPASLWLENANAMVVELIYYLLYNNSRKGLAAYLSEEGLIWAWNVFPETNHYASVFYIIFGLTDEGRANICRIVKATFDYIQSIRDTPEAQLASFFFNLRAKYMRQYRYHYCGLQCTMSGAAQLQYDASLGNVLCAASWQDAQFNYQALMNGLNLFRQDSLVIIETIPKYVTIDEIKADEQSEAEIQTAPYTEAPYITVAKKMDLTGPPSPSPSTSSISELPSSYSSPYLGFQGEFGIPPENRYLRDEYEERPPPNEGAEDQEDIILRPPKNHGKIKPQLLTWTSKEDSNGGRGSTPKIAGLHLGHRKRSRTPFTGHVLLLFKSSLLEATAHAQAISVLWALITTNKMKSKLSELNMAGYEVSIQRGNMVHIQGFPKHMAEIVGHVMNAMLDSEITETDFNIGKDLALVTWENVMSSPQLSSYFIQSLTQPLPPIDLMGTLQDLTLAELNCSIESFRKSASCTVVLMGNIPIQTFQRIATVLEGKEFGPSLNYNSSTSNCNSGGGGHSKGFKPGEKCIRVRNLASLNITTTVANVYTLGPLDFRGRDQKSQCFLAAMFFIKCEAFLRLRTNRQLGYSVFAQRIYGYQMRVHLMMFAVEVTCTARKFTQCELDTEIDTFLSLYGDALTNMDLELFNRMKKQLKLPSSLTKEEVGAWFSSLFEKDFPAQDYRSRCAVKGIRKVTFQILPATPEANLKPCGCDKCSNISTWSRGDGRESHLEYAIGKGEYKNYFATSV